MPKRFDTLRKFNRAFLNPIMKLFVAGRFSYYSLVYHVGRRSGKAYATPVVAVRKDADIYISLPYGTDTDWYRNVQKAGQCRIKIKGKTYRVNGPEVVGAEVAASAFPSEFQARIEKAQLNQFLQLKIVAER